MERAFSASTFKTLGRGNSWAISCRTFVAGRSFPSNWRLMWCQNERGAQVSRQVLPPEEGFGHVMNHDSLLCCYNWLHLAYAFFWVVSFPHTSHCAQILWSSTLERLGTKVRRGLIVGSSFHCVSLMVGESIYYIKPNIILIYKILLKGLII